MSLSRTKKPAINKNTDTKNAPNNLKIRFYLSENRLFVKKKLPFSDFFEIMTIMAVNCDFP